MIDIRRQSDIDAMLHIWYAFCVSRNRKAINAARAMERWHADPNSEGALQEPASATVLRLPVIRRHGR